MGLLSAIGWAIFDFIAGMFGSTGEQVIKIAENTWDNLKLSASKKIEDFKADFVSSVNHDIKSFLVPVSGFLKRILLGKYSNIEGPLKEKLTGIDDNVTKIQHLVENYLNVSRIESGRIEFDIRPVDINEIIR